MAGDPIDSRADYINQYYHVYTSKKGPPFQINSTPAKCLTLGVSFEFKLIQYAGYAQEVALYYLCSSNASASGSCWEEEPHLEEHLMHVSMGACVHIIKWITPFHGPANLLGPYWQKF